MQRRIMAVAVAVADPQVARDRPLARTCSTLSASYWLVVTRASIRGEPRLQAGPVGRAGLAVVVLMLVVVLMRWR